MKSWLWVVLAYSFVSTDVGGGFCQSLGMVAYNQEYSGVVFSVQYVDTIYDSVDTLSITFSCFNKTDSTILVLCNNLNNNFFNSLPLLKPEKAGSIILDLGGEWTYHIGYANSVKSIFLEPSGSFVQEIKVSTTLFVSLNHNKNSIEAASRSIEHRKFYISVGILVNEAKSIRFKEADSTGYLVFRSEAQGNFLDMSLQRRLLGPLQMRIKSE